MLAKVWCMVEQMRTCQVDWNHEHAGLIGVAGVMHHKRDSTVSNVRLVCLNAAGSRQ